MPEVEVIEAKTFFGTQDTWVRLKYSGYEWNLTMETAREIAAALYHYDLDKHFESSNG
jgi:hypothetical protein